MIETSVSPIRSESTAERDSLLRPALAVSIAIAIFAVVTQFLTATGAISLSTTQQLTMWLVAGGLIVLLWIAYMAVQAQARLGTALEATAAAGRAAEAAQKAAEEREERAAKAEQAAERKMAEALRMAAAGQGDTRANTKSQATEVESRNAWVPPGKLRRWRMDGPKRSVATADVFPNGCYLHLIGEGQDYDEKTDTGDASRPRRRMYPCVVVDLNPELKDRPHDAIVNVLTDEEPSLPPGVPHPLVKFDGLTITPYVTDRGAICTGYALCATGIRFAADEA